VSQLSTTYFSDETKELGFNHFEQRGKQLRGLRSQAIVTCCAKFSRRGKVGHWTIVKFEAEL